MNRVKSYASTILAAVLILVFGINAYGYYPIAAIQTDDGNAVVYCFTLDEQSTPMFYEAMGPDFLTKLIPPCPVPPNPELYDVEDPNFESYINH